MENASKALIIAGAILLSILIIGLGMFIYNQAKNASSGANLNSQKASAYNSEFEQYSGTQSGTNAKALCDLIKTHNIANTDDVSLQIDVKTDSAAATVAAPTALVTANTVDTIKKGLNAGKNYTIDFGYDKNTGYIVACGIVAK